MPSPQQPMTAEEQRVYDFIYQKGFPVTWAPYCDIGKAVDVPEIDVLNIVLKLRAEGAIPRIGAAFGAVLADQTEADRELMFLLYDIPTSEHPFDEIHEQLEFRGVDVTREWVPDRINEWVGAGIISRFGALPFEPPPEAP